MQVNRSDGALLLDARLPLQPDDGERIVMSYLGVRHRYDIFEIL